MVQLAQQLSSTMGESPPQPASNAAPGPSPAAPGPNPAGFSSLLGSVDPKVIAKFLPMLQSLTADQSHSMQLLNALKPYLKEEKQAKVERAPGLARLITVGKRFLLEWEGGADV